MNFKVGQKVVCIDDSAGWYQGGTGLEKNKIYSIVGISTVEHVQVNGMEYYWSPTRFRPLDEVAKGVTMTFEKLQTVQPIYQS